MAGGTVKADLRRLFHDAGITNTDLRHYANVARIYELGAEEKYLDAIGRDRRRERRVARKILAGNRA